MGKRRKFKSENLTVHHGTKSQKTVPRDVRVDVHVIVHVHVRTNIRVNVSADVSVGASVVIRDGSAIHISYMALQYTAGKIGRVS